MIRRSAADLTVILVAVSVCFILVITAVGIVVIELVNPDVDTSGLIELETELLGVLVGALVGFIGGRGYQQYQMKEASNASTDR